MKTKPTLALLLGALLLAGCRLAPYDAKTEQHLLALEGAHLAAIDTCAAMAEFDRSGLEAKAAVWREAYDEAMRHQERLVDNDRMRRETFRTAKDQFDKTCLDLGSGEYPLTPAFAENLRWQASFQYRQAVDGERGRQGSPDNP